MKTLLKIVLVGILLVNLSCSNSDKSKTNSQLDENIKASIIDDLKQNLKLSENFSGSEQVLESKVLEIDGNYYLRTTFDNEYVSTTLLKVDSSNNKMIDAGITCTSKACSESNGCIPDPNGTKCTPCGTESGDCIKTVSN